MKIKYKIKQLCFTATHVVVKARLKRCPVKDCILSITMSSDGLHFFQLQSPMKDCVSFKYNAL